MTDRFPDPTSPTSPAALVTETTTVIFSVITFVVSPVFPTTMASRTHDMTTHTAGPAASGVVESSMRAPSRTSTLSLQTTFMTSAIFQPSMTLASIPTPATSAVAHSKSGSKNKAALIGGITGGIALIIWVALFVAFCIHYYRRRRLHDLNERHFSVKTRGTSGDTEIWGGGAFGGLRSPEMMNRRSEVPDIKIERNAEGGAGQTDMVDLNHQSQDMRYLNLEGNGNGNGLNSGKKLSRTGLRWSTTQESMTVPYHLRIFRPRSEMTTSSIGGRPTTPSTMGGGGHIEVEEQPLPPPVIQLRNSQRLRSANGNGQQARGESPSQIGVAITTQPSPSPTATPAVSVSSELPILNEAAPPSGADTSSSSAASGGGVLPASHPARNFVFSLGKSGDGSNPDTHDATSRVQKFLGKKTVEVTTSSSSNAPSARSSTSDTEHPTEGVSYLRVPDAAMKRARRKSRNFYKRWSGGATTTSSSSSSRSRSRGRMMNWTTWWDSSDEEDGDEGHSSSHRQMKSSGDTIKISRSIESSKRKNRLSR